MAHLYLGHLLSNRGRGDEAVAEVRRARELDPGWQVLPALEGQFLFFARRYQDDVASFDVLAASRRVETGRAGLA